MLKDHAEVGADFIEVALQCPALQVRPIDLLAGDEHFPAGRPLEMVDTAQQGALARAARPDQHQHLAGRHFEIDAFEDLELAEALLQAAQADHRPFMIGPLVHAVPQAMRRSSWRSTSVAAVVRTA